MGLFDKIRNKSKMGKGQVKEKTGRAVGQPDLEARGNNEQTGGAARQATEKVKDAGKDLRKGMKP